MTNGLKGCCVLVIVKVLSLFLAYEWACLLVSRVSRLQQGSVTLCDMTDFGQASKTKLLLLSLMTRKMWMCSLQRLAATFDQGQTILHAVIGVLNSVLCSVTNKCHTWKCIFLALLPLLASRGCRVLCKRSLLCRCKSCGQLT